MMTFEPAALLYADADLVAVHKPPGVLVHRSRIDATAGRVLLQEVRDAIGQRVWPVHRLDKGTSGALVLALGRDAAAALGQAFATGGVDKRYLAIVRGWPSPAGSIDHPLTPRGDDADGMDAAWRAAAARTARTEYARLATLELPVRVDRHPTTRYALIEVRPRTGRRHQIRRHLKHIAHPVVGDGTFGKGIHNRFVAGRVGLTRLWLHAWSLAFTHPRSRAPMRIEAPLAAEWASILAWPGWHEDPPADEDAARALAAVRAALVGSCSPAGASASQGARDRGRET